MRTLYVMLTASLVIAGIPLISAAGTGCAYSPSQEGIAHPLNKTQYILVDAEKPEKIGQWTDVNGRKGLQSDDCFLGTVLMYKADRHDAVLP